MTYQVGDRVRFKDSKADQTGRVEHIGQSGKVRVIWSRYFDSVHPPEDLVLDDPVSFRLYLDNNPYLRPFSTLGEAIEAAMCMGGRYTLSCVDRDDPTLNSRFKLKVKGSRVLIVKDDLPAPNERSST